MKVRGSLDSAYVVKAISAIEMAMDSGSSGGEPHEHCPTYGDDRECHTHVRVSGKDFAVLSRRSRGRLDVYA